MGKTPGLPVVVEMLVSPQVLFIKWTNLSMAALSFSVFVLVAVHRLRREMVLQAYSRKLHTLTFHTQQRQNLPFRDSSISCPRKMARDSLFSSDDGASCLVQK